MGETRQVIDDELRRALAERAADIAIALLGRPSYRATHEMRWGRRGSLAVEISGDRAGMWYDHERGEGGDMLHLIERTLGCGLPDAVRWATSHVGRPTAHPVVTTMAMVAPVAPSGDDEARTLWAEAAPAIDGTPAERYLLSRGIDPARLPPHGGGTWPPGLRWHHGISALLVAVHDDAGEVRAVQRIYLMRDGSPQIRGGRKRKLTRGHTAGRAAQFGWLPDPRGRWAIAEGAETALAYAVLTGIPTWASLGASNMPHVTPPAWARAVTVCADHDDAGMRAAWATVEHMEALGLAVILARAATPGADAADLLAGAR